MNLLTYIPAPLLVACMLATSTAHAAFIRSIDDLSINGDLYDVTFLSQPFNQIYDLNANRIFGDDPTTINRAPTFFGNEALARLAAEAIISELGDTDATDAFSSTLTDTFAVPYAYASNGDVLIIMDDDIDLSRDFVGQSVVSASDTNFLTPYAVFEPSTQVPSGTVSAPPTYAIISLGLLGLQCFQKRKKA